MVIWRIRGNEIGPNGNGAHYFTTKVVADRFLREFKKDYPDSAYTDEPEKIVVRNREQLVDALHDAMGYGAS